MLGEEAADKIFPMQLWLLQSYSDASLTASTSIEGKNSLHKIKSSFQYLSYILHMEIYRNLLKNPCVFR